jgi:hypothetical protein
MTPLPLPPLPLPWEQPLATPFAVKLQVISVPYLKKDQKEEDEGEVVRVRVGSYRGGWGCWLALVVVVNVVSGGECDGGWGGKCVMMTNKAVTHASRSKKREQS